MKDKKVKMYFRGGQGLENPVDIDGDQIKTGDILSIDYGDDKQYSHISGFTGTSDEKKKEPFYLVEKSEKGFFFAESIEDTSFGGKFYLHDFRFKFCKIITKAP